VSAALALIPQKFRLIYRAAKYNLRLRESTRTRFDPRKAGALPVQGDALGACGSIALWLND